MRSAAASGTPWSAPAGSIRGPQTRSWRIFRAWEGDRWGTVRSVACVEEFDQIEFQAARTGNHVRAAVRMTQLAQEAEPGLRAEAHVRAGEQWMMADDLAQAAIEFSAAIEDGGATFADARVQLARALIGLDRDTEAEQLLAVLARSRAR